ncbi:MAG: sialate O-acetylesterase, partial [Bacteroidetes bacterium]|nr:sialate O-acetylesterase [Bacteroidota bacterium]
MKKRNCILLASLLFLRFRLAAEDGYPGGLKTASLRAVSATAADSLRLPRLIRDSMILQRDAHVTIWGWAQKGETIRVRFNNHRYRTTTTADGKWMIRLFPTPAGGPFTMDIEGKTSIRLHDILVGDVWLCSGQSNMVHQMRLHSVRYAREVADADNTDIRQFWVPNEPSLKGPKANLGSGSWKCADRQNIGEFSAVAYFFAKEIYRQEHVPIGIINASVGGSPIEAWISEEALKAFPDIDSIVTRISDTAHTRRPQLSSPQPNLPSAPPTLPSGNSPRPPTTDPGLAGRHPWYDTAYNPIGWRMIGIPGYWEDQGVNSLDGVVWYRREIEIPEKMLHSPARIFLGRIVDADQLYINGVLVGNTTYMYPQRRYTVPAGLLHPGKNLFVIRITNTSGKGGFVPDKPYCLFTADDTVDLKGYWQYKVGQVFSGRRGPGNGPGGHAGGGPGPNPRGGPGSNARDYPGPPQNQPAALFNGMLAPVIPYTIKGFCWYQGESNTGRAAEYARLQPALIDDWRKEWKEGPLPFLFVQLPGFGDYRYTPTESQWAELREAQARSLSIPNTAMAVAIDLGEWNDIHPDRKKEVGNRLALAALNLAYGRNIISSGPVF